MKRLAILLPLYFLLLTCMPCADQENDAGNGQTTISKAPTHEHDQDNETCSPFCSCNCCGQRAPSHKTSTLYNAYVSIDMSNKSPLQSFALQNVLQQIWQPPQLV